MVAYLPLSLSENINLSAYQASFFFFSRTSSTYRREATSTMVRAIAFFVGIAQLSPSLLTDNESRCWSVLQLVRRWRGHARSFIQGVCFEKRKDRWSPNDSNACTDSSSNKNAYFPSNFVRFPFWFPLDRMIFGSVISSLAITIQNQVLFKSNATYAFWLKICRRIISVKIDLTAHHAIFEHVVHTDVRNASKIFLENSMFAIYTYIVYILDKIESNDSNDRETKINPFLF